MNREIEKAVNTAFYAMPIDTWQRLTTRIIGAISDHIPEEDVPTVIEKIQYHGRQVSNIWAWELKEKGQQTPLVSERALKWTRQPELP